MDIEEIKINLIRLKEYLNELNLEPHCDYEKDKCIDSTLDYLNQQQEIKRLKGGNSCKKNKQLIKQLPTYTLERLWEEYEGYGTYKNTIPDDSLFVTLDDVKTFLTTQQTKDKLKALNNMLPDSERLTLISDKLETYQRIHNEIINK